MPKFTTVRFGDLDYRQDDVIHLPEGLVGMPDLRNWLMLEMGDELPMKWFQSLDRGDFGFPVTQAYLFHDEYEFPVGEPTRRRAIDCRPSSAIMLSTRRSCSAIGSAGRRIVTACRRCSRTVSCGLSASSCGMCATNGTSLSRSS